MIEAIDKRLLEWAEWRLGSVQGVAGYHGTMSAIIAGGGEVVRGTATEIYVSDSVLDTDQAYERLDEDLKRVVQLQYMTTLTPDQKAKKANVSRMTFYRRVDTAHQHLLYFLKPKAASKPNPVRDSLRRRRRVGAAVVKDG